MAKRPADPLRTMPIPKGRWCYSARLLDALDAAAVMFAATERKRPKGATGPGIPYLAHLLGVAAIVFEHGGTEQEAIGALLHDTLEDITPKRAATRTVRAFGPTVEAIVRDCTDGRPGKDGKKRPTAERKAAYVAHVPGLGHSALLVSAADKLHNARAIVADLRVMGDGLWERFNLGRDGQLAYYASLVRAFQANAASNAELVAELDRTVADMHRLAGAPYEPMAGAAPTGS